MRSRQRGLDETGRTAPHLRRLLFPEGIGRGIHENHTPNPAGDHRRRLRRSSAPPCACRERVAVADGAAGVALWGRRGQRHLVAHHWPSSSGAASTSSSSSRTSRARAPASPTNWSRAPRRTDTPSSMRPRRLRRPKPCSSKLNYDRKDLQPVAMAMMAPLFLVVNAEAPFKTLQEMIAHGKSKPDGLTFGSPGAGSQPHLAAELLFRDAGVKGLIVPVPRRQHGLHRAAGGPPRRHADRDQPPPCRTSRAASCACWAWPRPSAARSIPTPPPCVSRAFPAWSPPAGTVSWRRRQRRSRSSTGCRPRSFACSPIPR